MSFSDGTEDDLGGEDELSIITLESNIEKKPKKKKLNKPPLSPKSPYLSNTYLHPKKAAVWRPLKGTGLMHVENPSAKVPREMWVASLRQGVALSQSLKSESDTVCSRNSNYISTPEYLKEALGMKKPKHSRSASNGYVPGTPDYKEREDMYDEIIELKKMIQAQKTENDTLKTKLRRSEEENSRKEKQIDQLLDPSKSLEYARSLIDKKNDTSGIVNGLKKRIYKLEKQCKEKDSIINKLQTDLKTTNIEEMKIATEAYYEEIQRLRLLLTDNETADKKLIAESKESQKQQKVLNSTILRLSKSLKYLQEENKSLKVDLDQAPHSSGASSTTQGYNEWSKQRLVRRVLELEKKVSDQELAISQSRTNSRATERKRPQAGCAMDQTQQQDEQHVNQQQECGRLWELVKKLKEDRSHLQNQLATRDTEVKQLIQEKSEMDKELQRLGATQADKSPKEYRGEICSLTEKIKQLEAEFEDYRRMKLHCNDLAEVHSTSSQSILGLAKNHQATSASSSQQKQEGSREQAAKTIQKHWHQYRNQKEDTDMEEAITVIQASARGHLARKKLEGTHSVGLKKLPVAYPQQNKNPQVSHSNNIQNQLLAEDERDEAVSFIQSSFRAHLTRMQHLRDSAEQRKGTSARDTKETTITVRKSSNVQRRSRYSDDEYSDEIEEDIFEIEDQEEAEPLKKLKISPNRPSSSRSSRYLPQTSQEVESDDSDNVIVASPSWPPKCQDSNF
ncbi:IQ domain-containing protein E isoform X1 [Carcharodon carcharias]|uniref:IQ domain-containing protein E isoform X1 n=1 Tax=Carcharodon carcharias TaxID=13397 RepID=UPI001B7E7B53|nr:IQ domain-containing protein E isoform X1 [Carcharodon carcharias]